MNELTKDERWALEVAIAYRVTVLRESGRDGRQLDDLVSAAQKLGAPITRIAR
jgi:hypothetical protein